MHIPPKPSDVTFTDDQWKAIYASGHDILVSAAAGSGKTKVLITRLIEKVLDDKNPINVDELLVVTFTNAAAAEMRHRMGTALEEAIALHPESPHLRKQLSLLNKAQISSMHSFCLNVVRQYAYLLDIDPGFRIADPTEAALLRDDTIADVLEDAYSAEDPEAVYRLADSFTSDRNDQSLELLIDRLYDYSRVHPDPESWLLQIPQQYEIGDEITIDDLEFIGPLKSAIQQKLEEAAALATDMHRIADLPDGPTPLIKTAEADLVWINEAIRSISISTWEQTHALFQQLVWVKAGAVKKDSCDEELAKRAKSLRDSVKKLVTGIKDAYFVRTPARLLTEIRLMAPMMHTLIELVIEFGHRYRTVKSEKGIVDFSDLEHFALDILTNREGDILVPSDIAMDYRSKFKEVLVDEYQDTNLLQEAIVQFVKSGTESDGNLFMVGDVKQSIYRFRLAEPGLFLGKYGRFTEEAMDQGLKIDLNASFRSRKEVLDATNFIFSQIMGERVGEIEYDEAAALKYGARYPEMETAAHLTVLYSEEEFEDETTEDLENLKSSQAEARYMVKKIKQWMSDGHEVCDAFSGEKRPIRYSDIVVLMRSMTWSAEIAEEFQRAEIPVYVELSRGYFDALEVTIMLNTLRVIDNPYQDIPLASVLRAPFVGMTENELAEVRLAAKNVPFYEALKTFIATKGSGMAPETQQKLQRFILAFEEWRNLARRGSLSELIWQVYRDTNYYEMVGSMPNGKQRQANLRALHDRAIEYEKTSFRGLFRFLRFVDRMQRRGDDLGAARYLSEKEDVVRIMTIHSSKGLEFPNVFVAGIGRQFNKMDFNEPYLFDQHFGLAVKAIDPDKRIMYTSLPFLAMKEQKELEMRSEEMRILYVAMTRAKEQLELVATVKDIEKSITKWQDAQLVDPVERLPDYMRSRANGYLDWIGPAVARHADFKKFGTTQGALVKEHPSKWAINALPVSYFSESLSEPEFMEDLTETEELPIPVVDESILAEVTRRFDYHYPYDASVKKRSKVSVTELKRIAQLEAESSFNDPFASRNGEVSQAYLHARPAFLQQRSISAAELGTAMHTVMQHIDLAKTNDLASVDVLLEELLQRQLLTAAEVNALDRAAIVQFTNSPVSERMQQATRVLKELPFTFAVEGEDGDSQILQGIADCLFEEQDGWVLLDYKTDRLKDRFASREAIDDEMHSRYHVQLSLYKTAIEAITHVTIKEMLLYLFDEGRALTVQEETV